VTVINEQQPLLGTDSPGLINRVAAGLLQLPEFQRPYRWGSDPSRTCSLLASIIQGWPAGSLLLMEGDGGFGTLNIEKWSDASDPNDGEDRSPTPEHLILDGQQRLTALYLAYLDKADSTFMIHIDRILRAGKVVQADDMATDTFIAVDSEEFRDLEWNSLAKRVRDGVMMVSEAVDDDALFRWRREASETEAFEDDFLTDLVGAGTNNKASLARLRHYNFPVSIVPSTIVDDALTTIFVEINQQGIPLDTFDLVAARTLRTGRRRFNLRTLWLELTADETVARDDDNVSDITPELMLLHKFNLKTTPKKKHGETPLKVLLLAQDDEQDEGKSLSPTAMVNLDPDYIRDNFKAAAEALEATLSFLVEEVSLIPDTLADDNYLLPIAVCFFRDPGLATRNSDRARTQRSRIRKWFWAASLQMIFATGGTAGLVISETEALSDWLTERDLNVPGPSSVADFWENWDEHMKHELVEPQKTRTHLMKALMALDVAHGAKDWIGRRPTPREDPGEFTLKDTIDFGPGEIKLDAHHLWPRGAGLPPRPNGNQRRFANGVLVPHGQAAINCILNRVLLLKSTNIKVSASPPHTARTTTRDVREINLGTYLLDPSKRTWRTLAQSRLEKIEEKIQMLIPRAPED
jgi:hypothetical protein